MIKKAKSPRSSVKKIHAELRLLEELARDNALADVAEKIAAARREAERLEEQEIGRSKSEIRSKVN